MNRFIAFAALTLSLLPISAADAPPPVMKSVTVSNSTKTVTFTPAPATEQYTVRSSTDIAAPFTNDGSGVLNGTTFKVTNTEPTKFYSVGATSLSSNDLLSVNLLNRIAYGPTPDELVRVKTMGPQAFINEQLAPEIITEPTEVYTSQTTNGVPPPATPQWQFLTYTGLFTSSNLYVYLRAPGDAYIDDISLKPLFTVITTNIDQVSTNYVTNIVEGSESIVDGDFENPLSLSVVPGLGRWVETANMANSSLSSTYAHAGTQSLHMVALQAGTTEGNSIYQRLTNLTFNFNAGTQRGVLRFWYLSTATSRNIKVRLSGGAGINGSGNDQAPAPEWIYARATGTATSTRTMYIYLSGSGEAYLDDIKLVPGTVPEVGPNLIRNGDFEAPLNTNNWNPTANFTRSRVSTNVSHSGSGSLKVIATSAGSGGGNAIFQTNIFVTNAQTYTVSFWYLHPTRGRTLTVRLSGADPGNSGMQAIEPSGSIDSIGRSLDRLQYRSVEDGTETANTVGGGSLADLRAYHVLNAVSAKRQLVEVLLQFLENHFVTQHAKSVDYFDRFYDDGTLMDIFATDWEYRERSKWRNKLLDPNCNFYDLLKIHIESPAEIVYLDSVDSKGNAANVANENYAREIQELFCMGVDNGYEQQDIIAMSRAWTGWSVDIVDPENIDNPLALRTERIGFYPGNGSSGQGALSNYVGVWTFNFKSASHGTNRAPIWSLWDPASPATNPQPLKVGGVPQSKTVPARFGPPWAGMPYALTIPPNRTNTLGILDGYDVATSIANLPFTMEFISVKLCRWFVHEDFVHGVYNYTDPNRSAEAELVRQCMVAWDTPVNGRKGNIRSVLNVIFNSDLFRSHGGSLQKVKTPLEFAASTIRALRSTNSNGGFTASTDGYSISGRSRTASSAPLTRMGSMMLFDRDAPDGYPEAGSPWISSGTLAERIRFIQTTLMSTTDTNKPDLINGGTPGNNLNFNLTDPVGLLKARLPAINWNNAEAVADLFLGFLYPGEGKANLDEYRTLAINFLNTNDNGIGQSLFTTLGNTTPAYDTRVRAMVAMLMTLPRFQEQ